MCLLKKLNWYEYPNCDGSLDAPLSETITIKGKCFICSNDPEVRHIIENFTPLEQTECKTLVKDKYVYVLHDSDNYLTSVCIRLNWFQNIWFLLVTGTVCHKIKYGLKYLAELFMTIIKYII